MEMPKQRAALGELPSDLKRTILFDITSRGGTQAIQDIYSYLAINKLFLNLLDVPTLNAIITLLVDNGFHDSYTAYVTLVDNAPYWVAITKGTAAVAQKMESVGKQWKQQFEKNQKTIQEK